MIVLAIARSVGILVAVVAVLLWFVVIVWIKAAIGFLLSSGGAVLLLLVLVTSIKALLKYLKISPGLVWTLLRRSCS
jgi:hypothetical protein